MPPAAGGGGGGGSAALAAAAPRGAAAHLAQPPPAAAPRGATARLRVTAPRAPHAALQLPPHSPHAVTSASQHGAVAHARVSNRAGQGAPPPCAWDSTARARCVVPPPHVALHVPPLRHTHGPTAQSACSRAK